MDLNYLLQRRQVSLMRANAAACDPSRLSHERLAALYAREVHRHQRALGAPAQAVF